MYEDRTLRTPLSRQREVLLELGTPVSAETLAQATPRRSLMRRD